MTVPAGKKSLCYRLWCTTRSVVLVVLWCCTFGTKGFTSVGQRNIIFSLSRGEEYSVTASSGLIPCFKGCSHSLTAATSIGELAVQSSTTTSTSCNTPSPSPLPDIIQLQPTTPPLSSQQQQRLDWNGRIQQLCEFQHQYGHTCVPKRYKDHPGLANWVNKQRQHYKRYHNGTRPCSLNEKRIAQLEEHGFCWDGRKHHMVDSSSSSSFVPSPQQTLEDRIWWKYWAEFQQSMPNAEEVPASSALRKWLRQQRRLLLLLDLSEEKRHALDQVDANWWMTRSERTWERHLQTLVNYATIHGNCSVPIAHPNQRLAHFVSNQRKQYNLRQKQRPTTMTEERLRRLESIGFAWSHNWGTKRTTPTTTSRFNSCT
jgi:Helicase associated domain